MAEVWELHAHSSASDGVFTPSELVHLAREAGVTTLALTDHDTAGGVPEARDAARRAGIRLISGMELSCRIPSTVHVLGLGIDESSEEVAAYTRRRAQERVRRVEEMCTRLHSLGVPLEAATVLESAGRMPGRMHVARALMAGGFCRSLREAFDRYLREGRPAFVPYEEFTVTGAVELIRRAGGVSILAHPMRMGFSMGHLESLVAFWHEAGLEGLEVYHPSTGNQHVPGLLRIAAGHALLVTGGSDYHGQEGSGEVLGSQWQRWSGREADSLALQARLTRATGERNA